VRKPFVHLRFTAAERVVLMAAFGSRVLGPTCIDMGQPHVGLPFWFAKNWVVEAARREIKKNNV